MCCNFMFTNPFMSNPFGFGYGMYSFNQPTYDMLRTDSLSMWNVNCNMWAESSMARQGLYMNYTNPYGYSSYGGIMTAPPSMEPYAACLVNSLNGLSANPWGNNVFTYPNSGTVSGGNGSSSDSNLTAEEKDYKRKYNKLLTLMKQFANSEEFSGRLTSDELETLTDAIKSKKGSYEEKYTELKEEYDEIFKNQKETMREFLRSDDAKNLLASGTNKFEYAKSNNKNSFYKQLIGAGYEFDDTEVDSMLANLDTAIDGLVGNGANGNLTADNLISNAGKAYSVLDIISSWNSKYDTKLMDKIAEKYNESENTQVKERALSTAIRPLTEALVEKAEEIAKRTNDSTIKSQLNKKIEKLEKELKGIKTEKKADIDSSFTDAFDDLYKYTRIAAAGEIQAKAVGTYGDLDPDVFNANLFMDETLKDLKKEGFNVQANDPVVKAVNTNSQPVVATTEERDETPGGAATGERTNPSGGVTGNYGTSSVDEVEEVDNTNYVESGLSTYTLLKKYNDSYDYELAQKTFDNVINESKDNPKIILDFVQGWYSGSGYHKKIALFRDFGIIHSLENEMVGKEYLSKDTRNSFIDAFINAVKTTDLKNDKDLKELEIRYNKYKDSPGPVPIEYSLKGTGLWQSIRIDQLMVSLSKKIYAAQQAKQAK